MAIQLIVGQGVTHNRTFLRKCARGSSMARQKPTNPDTPDWTLTPQQETAVDLLVSGKTVTDTATAVEVTRQTVSEWLNHHPGFQAALNRRRQELWSDM